jgi:protein tyrosine phosphatase
VLKSEEFMMKNYINASYIKGSMDNYDQNIFISTQGPTKKTFDHFWRMIALNGVRYIFMLCNLFEDTRVKCDQYWPSGVNEILDLSNILIQLISEDFIIADQVIERKLKITIGVKDNSDIIEHYCSQIHIINWPDHSIPDDSISYKLFDTLVSLIDKNFAESSNKTPIVVHCSAGVGRTGTLICLYTCYNLIMRQLKYVNTNELINEKSFLVSIFSVARKLREQRYLFITDVCQYKLIYHFIYEWIKNNCNL